MKRILSVAALLILLLVLSGCTTDPAVLKGYTAKQEYFDPAGFQDFTDYCKYVYDENADDAFKQSGLYQTVSDSDVSRIAGYFENFSGWANMVDHLKGKYDFDNALISAGDYYYIKTKEGTPIGDSEYGVYDNYTVYFYDMQTHTLFYIHNNI